MTPCRRPTLAVVLATAAAVLVLGGCAGQQRGAGRGVAPAAGVAPAPAGTLDAAGSFDRPADPPAAPGFEVGRLPDRLAAPGGSPPAHLSIPAIGVETPLVRLGLEPDRTMEVPEDFGQAGWFAGGPAPGRPGPAVIAGHVDSRQGPAVFYRLRDLRPGDEVRVERADGARLRFVVDTTRSFPKAEFPTSAVFGPTPEAALRLVTCAGSFDRARGSYRDNLVVFARLEQQSSNRD
jgi:sortase (surface protein transpeptidase)